MRPPAAMALFPAPFGDFQLRRRLQIGLVAEVFDAMIVRGPRLGTRVALRRALPLVAEDPARADAFLTSACQTPAFIHPLVPFRVAAGVRSGVPYVAYRWIPGVPLGDVRDAVVGGHLPRPEPAVIARIAADVLATLAAAHALPVFHGDVSSPNLLLGLTGRTFLLDWNDAYVGTDTVSQGPEVRAEEPQAWKPGGTPGYAAPSQLAGAAPSAASDFFGLGVVLAELLLGDRAFSGPRDAWDAPTATATAAELSQRLGELPAHPAVECAQALLTAPTRVPEVTPRVVAVAAPKAAVERLVADRHHGRSAP